MDNHVASNGQQDLVKQDNIPDLDIRWSVADNENTPPDVLSTLAEDVDWAVRLGVAGNKNTPPDVLCALAGDDDWSVRYTVENNKNTPPDVLVEP